MSGGGDAPARRSFSLPRGIKSGRFIAYAITLSAVQTPQPSADDDRNRSKHHHQKLILWRSGNVELIKYRCSSKQSSEWEVTGSLQRVEFPDLAKNEAPAGGTADEPLDHETHLLGMMLFVLRLALGPNCCQDSGVQAANAQALPFAGRTMHTTQVREACSCTFAARIHGAAGPRFVHKWPRH